MIRVAPKPQPRSFATQVRTPGNTWLADQGYDLAAALPKGAKPPPYWRKCLSDLHQRYDGVCAYLAVYVEMATGGSSVDHFVAKSSLAGQTYEWKNYRLACSMMNSRKRAFDDVLDPFSLPTEVEVFRLELASGRIYVNPSLPGPLASQAEATKDRLKLDNGINRALRARHFADYLTSEISKTHLGRVSPFVHAEVVRQGL